MVTWILSKLFVNQIFILKNEYLQSHDFVYCFIFAYFVLFVFFLINVFEYVKDFYRIKYIVSVLIDSFLTSFSVFLFNMSFCVSVLGVVNLNLSSDNLIREQSTLTVACNDENGP